VKSSYAKLIEREKSLLGDVEIITDVAYWPVRFVEPTEQGPETPRRQVFRFIQLGYQDKASLQRRLRHVPDLDHHLEWLTHQALVGAELTEGAAANGAASFRVLREWQRESPGGTSSDGQKTFDAVSGTLLTLPDVMVALSQEERDPSIPVLAEERGVPWPTDVRFVECLLMVILSGPRKARAVRVFHQLQDVVCLQEILYDLLLDDSRRLSSTKIATGKANAQSPKEMGDTAPPLVVPDETSATDRNPVLASGSVLPQARARAILPGASSEAAARSGRPAAQPSPPRTALVQIVSGRRSHEELLEQAMNEARTRVLIVTPFIRRRLTDARFRNSLSDALRRGVDVSIVHGMPTHADQFDDTAYENQRIENLVREIGRHAVRLKFIRVTQNGSSTAGEHSKILVCDDRWAVVTSFNWLSFQETNETGVRVGDPDSVAKLAALFDAHLRVKTDINSHRAEVEAAWPLSSREMSEWIYGEHNSQ